MAPPRAATLSPVGAKYVIPVIMAARGGADDSIPVYRSISSYSRGKREKKSIVEVWKFEIERRTHTAFERSIIKTVFGIFKTHVVS